MLLSMCGKHHLDIIFMPLGFETHVAQAGLKHLLDS